MKRNPDHVTSTCINRKSCDFFSLLTLMFIFQSKRLRCIMVERHRTASEPRRLLRRRRGETSQQSQERAEQTEQAGVLRQRGKLEPSAPEDATGQTKPTPVRIEQQIRRIRQRPRQHSSRLQKNSKLEILA